MERMFLLTHCFMKGKGSKERDAFGYLRHTCRIGTFPTFRNGKVIRYTVYRENFAPFLLVHLSRRLKCTIVIMRCPSSVRRR